MANRFVGEVSVVVDGKSYTLRLDMNALVEFEEMTGKSALDMQTLASSEGVKIADLRAVIHAALKRHHPDAPAAVAGDILSQDLGIVEQLFLLAAPENKGGKVGNGHPKVAKPPRG